MNIFLFFVFMIIKKTGWFINIQFGGHGKHDSMMVIQLLKFGSAKA